MNYLIVKSIIGRVLYFEAAFMLLPCITALIYQEYSGWSFVFTALLCILIGAVLTRKRPENTVFYVKEGFVTVALSWIVLSLMGGLSFLFSGVISNPIDALFETVSGFTTTGASILKDVEVLPRCMLMWRSFTHWIGGMGVLVFLLSFMQMHGGSHMNLMKAESPGPSVSKLTPTVQSTAKILYIIYIVVTVFMILFGVNFNAYFLIWCRKFTQAFRMEEVRCYFGIIFASIAVITLNIAHLYSGVGEALRHAAFQVGSIITTTGYATTDFNLWPQASRTILVLLMFIGACAGSTGGGIKVSRFIILIKTIKKELHTLLHPRSIRKLKLDGHTLEHEVVRSTNVFLIAYVLVFAFSILLISFDGLDMVTNFTGVAAALNNIGPGLELVGPTQNFSIFSNGAKLVLTFDMLAGRLELFPMLLLFVRETWKRY